MCVSLHIHVDAESCPVNNKLVKTSKEVVREVVAGVVAFGGCTGIAEKG